MGRAIKLVSAENNRPLGKKSKRLNFEHKFFQPSYGPRDRLRLIYFDTVTAMNKSLSSILTDLIQADPLMMETLRAARSLALPDWCIAGGFVRAKVWDHLHGYSDRTPPTDIDLLYFDPLKVDPEHENKITASLNQIFPGVEWEPVNQARMHTYNQDPPYLSTIDALSHWAETANCVGVSLNQADEIEIQAPLGLDDLFNMIVRPNLKSPTARQVYLDRLQTKGWKARWPKLQIQLP